MEVIVGSTNPVKVRAVRSVFARAFRDRDIKVEGIDVDLGLPDQPLGDDETRRCAVARAAHVLATTDADVGVGLEGGVAFESGGEGDGGEREAHLIGWCAIITRDGVLSVARGASMPLPPAVGREIAAGRELGPVMDELTGVHNSKQKLGAIGYFTCGLLPREKSWEYTITCALVKLLRPEHYAGEGGRGGGAALGHTRSDGTPGSSGPSDDAAACY
ncbi:MAG: inosine/xanthosine triphosphatase [Firmicutes bacterium]|nr:inosine/xanthosine triphosphatase [Bacillota bacterium]